MIVAVAVANGENKSEGLVDVARKLRESVVREQSIWRQRRPNNLHNERTLAESPIPADDGTETRKNPRCRRRRQKVKREE